jgi:hypothetical protein
MLLAIVCLGHLQQRPGSDLPQLRAGVLQWVTTPGIPAAEVLEVTSHLVWTHQTAAEPRQLLGPRPSLSVRHAYTLLTRSRRTTRRQAHRRFVVQALRHSAATREQVDAAVSPFIGCFGRLWHVPWENGYKEVFRRLAVYGVRSMLTLFLSPMPLRCCGLRCPWRLRTVAAACFLRVCDCSGSPLSGAARVGERCVSAVGPVAG